MAPIHITMQMLLGNYEIPRDWFDFDVVVTCDKHLTGNLSIQETYVCTMGKYIEGIENIILQYGFALIYIALFVSLSLSKYYRGVRYILNAYDFNRIMNDDVRIYDDVLLINA